MVVWEKRGTTNSVRVKVREIQGGESQELSKEKAGQAWVEAGEGPPPPQVLTQWREEGPDKDRVKDLPRSGGAEDPGCPQEMFKAQDGAVEPAPSPTPEAMPSTSAPPPWGRVPGAGSRAPEPPPAL